MQQAVPELTDLRGESAATLFYSPHREIGLCPSVLMARRMVERGVRFVELSCLTENIGAGGAANPWINTEIWKRPSSHGSPGGSTHCCTAGETAWITGSDHRDFCWRIWPTPFPKVVMAGITILSDSVFGVEVSRKAASTEPPNWATVPRKTPVTYMIFGPQFSIKWG